MADPHRLFQTAMKDDPAEQSAAIIEHLVSLSESLSQIRNDLASARDELHTRADATERQVQELRHAFPADDPAGHRAYHDEVIAIARARKEFWQKLLFELAKWGLLGFVAWLVLAGWRDFLKGPN
ncbi:MAG: hypothetical protein ACRCTX_26340 [Afipia sp.]